MHDRVRLWHDLSLAGKITPVPVFIVSLVIMVAPLGDKALDQLGDRLFYISLLLALAGVLVSRRARAVKVEEDERLAHLPPPANPYETQPQIGPPTSV